MPPYRIPAAFFEALAGRHQWSGDAYCADLEKHAWAPHATREYLPNIDRPHGCGGNQRTCQNHVARHSQRRGDIVVRTERDDAEYGATPDQAARHRRHRPVTT